MSYYDDDFYHEPSEFDELVDNFKETLMKSVKEDYLNEMKQLRKENNELQEVKRGFENIKNSYAQKKHDLEYEYKTLQNNVRRERLSQLMKELEVELYTVASRSKAKPKCNKCDENRRINYETPSGKKTFESCKCDIKKIVYEPISIILSSFSIRSGEGFAWYQIKDSGRHDEYLSHYDDSILGDGLITSEDQFESIGYAYKTLFKTKEIAQKYCDYKNTITK